MKVFSLHSSCEATGHSLTVCLYEALKVKLDASSGTPEARAAFGAKGMVNSEYKAHL
jgi:hypothetical protein